MRSIRDKAKAGDIIRAAIPADLPAILEIHNDAIENTLSIWVSRKVPLANREAWFADRKSKSQPILVAERDGKVLAYASYGDFRNGDGYRLTVENSIYVHRDMHGSGIASALMVELIAIARGMGLHAMVAAIGLPNPASVALHAKFGFIEAGILKENGIKKGQWLDLLLMQLTLDDRGPALR